MSDFESSLTYYYDKVILQNVPLFSGILNQLEERALH